MGAIFGICNTDNKPVEKGSLELMQQELNHWKADDKNVWLSGNTGFGHLMLYNTPESLSEHLPYSDSLSQLVITSDARIDNRDELFGLLGVNTPGEKEMADSQLILLAYKKYGVDCVKYLVGDFAFAIWDSRNQQLFCVRDQMGVKPFFYYYKDGMFAFASEKKGLLCLPGLDKAINKQFFYNQCFRQNIQAADTTLYQHIHRLAPAHDLVFCPANGKLQLSGYWTLDPTVELQLHRKEDYYDGLRHHFETAVKCRLRSVYPIGIELSGGIDSSSITGVASHLLKDTGTPLTTFTNADNAESLPYSLKKGGSEVKYAEEVIRFNNIAHPVFITSPISDDPIYLIELLEKINDGMELWHLIWQLPIKQEAMNRNIRTVLSGFPGDEMATYRGGFYFLDYLDHRNYLAYIKTKTDPVFKKIKPFIGPETEYFLHKLNNLTRMRDADIKKATMVFPFPLKYRMSRGDVVWQDINFKERFNSYRHYQRYRLLKPQIALRMEMESHYGTWYRSEARFPMADIRLTGFYLSIPNPIKYEGELTRSAWRKSIGRYLPEEILRRDTKTGIMTPYTKNPALFEIRMAAFTGLIKDLPAISPKKINRILSYFSVSKEITNYHILFNWYKKNFGEL